MFKGFVHYHFCADNSADILFSNPDALLFASFGLSLADTNTYLLLTDPCLLFSYTNANLLFSNTDTSEDDSLHFSDPVRLAVSKAIFIAFSDGE